MDESARAPLLRSQHLPQPVSSDPPFLGRDPLDRGCAIFAIAESLQQLGLAHQTNRLLRWLGRFEGLEQHLEDESDPVVRVRLVLLQHVADQPVRHHVTEAQQARNWHSLVIQLVAQPFAQTCGDWGRDGIRSRIKWDPMQHSFMTFLALGQPGEELSIWTPTDGQQIRAQHFARMLLQEEQA